VVLAATFGCTHSRTDPFVHTEVQPTGAGGGPPPCFTGALADCIDHRTQLTNAELFPSRWRYPFHPDLYARVCRGDDDARQRLLDAVRRIENGRADHLEGIYLSFLNGCSSADFCNWTLGVAGDDAETAATRNLFLEASKRGCESVVDEGRMEQVATDLGRSLATEPKWRTNTSDARCAEVPRLEQPWDDIAALHGVGCLDLTDWIDQHRNDPNGTAEALERCIEHGEIRYREADCLRELAGLDRRRAVAFLYDESRRGWGISSTINRYAKTLLRFPEEGQLESELASMALLSAQPPPMPESGQAAVLPHEILELHGRLLRFNPSCAVRYCEHATLMYDLAALVSPTLDDLVIAERWPALEEVRMGTGNQAVSTTIRGIPITFSLDEDETGSFDHVEYDQRRDAAEHALTKPHEIIVYLEGKPNRLPIRNLGEWYDVEALIGGLNTILSARKSDMRFITLAPHCVPCAQVLAGPGDGLIEASLAGLIEVVDPFNELWTQPTFDAKTVTGDR
jgi:hypothetical protein